MFGVACMIFANDVAVHFAIALLFMSKNETMQKQQKDSGMWVLTRFCFCCRIWLVYVLYRMYDICL